VTAIWASSYVVGRTDTLHTLLGLERHAASPRSGAAEISNPIRFSQDRTHAAYDASAVHRFWRALLQVDRLLKLFRSGFLGQGCPVHFFWGSFDLAVTHFSDRRAPLQPGGVPRLPDDVTREAYSH